MWYKAGLHEVFPLGRFSNPGLCSLNLAPESFLPQHAVSCLRTSAYPHFLIPAFTFGTFCTTWSECGFSPYMRRNVPTLVTATGSYYKCRLMLYSIPTPRLFVQLSEYTVRSCSLPNHSRSNWTPERWSSMVPWTSSTPIFTFFGGSLPLPSCQFIGISGIFTRSLPVDARLDGDIPVEEYI